MNTETPAEAIYSGEFPRSLDAKNRVTIPASWVSQGVVDFQVVPKTSEKDSFLVVLPPKEFAQMEAKILELDKPMDKKRIAVRAFYSSARAVAADKQGRILLPEDYCKKAGLGTEVVLVGGKSRFEIWDASRWRAASEDLSAAFQEMAEEIGL